MTKEEAAYGLADAFIKMSKENGSFNYSMRTIDKGKWWVHFKKAAAYRSKEGWKPETHIKCCFEKFGPIMPFRIYGKLAEEAWEELHHRYDEVNKNNFLVQMLDTYKFINKWNSGNGYNPKCYPFMLMQIKRKRLSVYFLSLSKSFRELNEEEGFYTKETLDIKRLIVMKNRKVYNKMREVFGEDLYKGR